MSAATKEDTRNTAWRSNNVGSRLLQKMGWKDGQAVGKRQQEQQTGAESVKVSGEGLRVIKRQDGLGLGAQQTGLLAPSAQPHHVQQFSDVLSNLQQSHKSSSRRSKKKRAAASSAAAAAAAVILPTNKSTHQQVRQAKFSEKTDEDMKCIFGGGLPDFPVIATTDDIDGDKKPQNKKKKKKRKKSKRRGESQLQSDEDRKRSRKKRKKEKEL